MNATIARYLLGLASIVAIWGALALAATAIRRRYLPELDGAPARLAEAVLGLGLLVGVMEVVGVAGLFSLWAIVGGCVLVCAATFRALPGFMGLRSVRGRVGAFVWVSRPAIVVALIATAAVAAEWAVPTLQSYDVGIRTFDSVWYHLPWAASFAQTGQIATLRFTDVEYLTAFYPATAELFHGLGIVLFARDTISPALNLLWLGLALLAAYCVGRPRGAGAATLAGGALAMATPMMRFSQPGSAANDVVGIFFLLAAVALLLNAPGQRGAVTLAGLAAGLAVGVKLSMIAAAVGLAVGAIWIAPRGRRGGDAARWIAAMLLGGGFWYLRNLIAVGNPLPWLHLPGLPHPSPPLQQHTAFSVAHYMFNGHVISSTFEPGLAAGLGSWWAVLLAASVIGPLLCLLPGAGGLLRMLGLVALAALLAYLLTPESAAGPAGAPLGFAFNLRYAAPALALCLTVAPLAPPFAGIRRQWALLAGYALVLVATLAHRRLWPGSHVPGAVAIGAGAMVLETLALTGRRGRARQPRRLMLAAVGAAILLAATAGGYRLQRHYLHGRYAYHPHVSSLARVWALFRRARHSRVGVVGTFGGFFSYPLFGIDDSNRVQYIADRGPHGSFTPIGSCAAWRAAVNAARLRYLVSTPARDPWHPNVLSPSPESRWTYPDPAVSVRYAYRAAGQPIRVYRIRARLDPQRCG